VASDGAGGLFATWADPRSTQTGPDIYASRFTGEGPLPTQVRGLAAHHHDGQTFLTWTTPTPAGWTYRVYASSTPIASGDDLAGAGLVGAVGDSTWCDRRLSSLLGTTRGYHIDSLAAPLDSSRGLFVRTASANGATFYAATAQPGGLEEDRTVVPRVNALTAPVCESVALPRPIYQGIANTWGLVYTLWTSHMDTPLLPAMANRPGVAYDCGVLRPPGKPAPWTSLMVRFPWKHSNFLDVLWGTGVAGEWTLALDEPPLSTLHDDTFWFGYHEDYDATSPTMTPPTSGTVHDYTVRRVAYTIEWALRTFPVDATRVYAQGASGGGIGVANMLFARPDLFAAGIAIIGIYDFSFSDDPNPACLLNTGMQMRRALDALWGTVPANLPCSAGLPVYELLDHGAMASRIEPQAVPPLFGFNGKNDTTVGWAEKVGFYEAMRQARQGGCFFFDSRSHLSGIPAWVNMQDETYLFRFTTKRSFPALSNCSADDDPGDGTATSGDSIGTVNGFVEWDTSLVDLPECWTVTLRLRDLYTLYVRRPAPESLTVDVTPRRLQGFQVLPARPCTYAVVRLADGDTVQRGSIWPDSLGRLTVEGVKVYRAGSQLTLNYSALLGVGWRGESAALALALGRNPAAGRTELALTWPAVGEGRVELYDVAGRLLRVLWSGPSAQGPARLSLETARLSGGLYFVRARAGGAQVTRRLVVLR